MNQIYIYVKVEGIMNTTLQLSRIIDSVNNELTDHMNFFRKVFFLALFLFQRPCWKPSPHRKANKCHGVGVLKTWPFFLQSESGYQRWHGWGQRALEI